MKLGEEVGCVTRTKRFDFGEDPNEKPDMRIFLIEWGLALFSVGAMF